MTPVAIKKKKEEMDLIFYKRKNILIILAQLNQKEKEKFS